MSKARPKESNVIALEILKREIGGLGFLVRERRSRATVLVSEIIQGGAAYDCGLIEVGDIVLAVNSTSLIDISYQDALVELRAVAVGSRALLLLRAPEGYSTGLETTFDSNGKARTVRVTEPISGKHKEKNSLKQKIVNKGRVLSPIRNTSNGKFFGKSSKSKKEMPEEFEEEKNFASHIDAGGKPTPPSSSQFRENDDNQRRVVVCDEPKSEGPRLNSEVLEKPTEEEITDTGGKMTEQIQKNGVVSQHTDDGLPKMPVNGGCPFSGKKEDTTTFCKLRNWETGERTNDTLFAKAKMVSSGCARNRCIGSMMNPDHMSFDPRKTVRTMEEKLELAVDFIKQYYGSMKRKNPEAEVKRLAEVTNSIQNTGTYELTEYELIFGAKTAWRNAPRCIGRIQWNKLQVFDYRRVDNTAQMFDAICKHLKYATNKGNIRSCITFFPQRTDYKKEFRVWNSQYIRYAAYKQDDGSIIGDPANLEFTELCQKLGWKGKGGRFDILPLLLQANGQDPDMYEIPPDLLLEVEIRHPRLKCFEELAFKWYAVPAVSNVMLDIGGIEFPAAPFNGWFMGTEIGRDLCDVARYNVLEEVAEKMNLDTKNSSSLWKDIALVEFNVAVLYSFQKDRVTIMDHHSATQSFMKHYANELKLRGGCPGDWVWLTPPISGSITPIFHQEVLNYILTPACVYQPDPWKYHVWKGKKIAKAKKAIGFKELAKSVLIMSSMMGKAMANRIKATIIYATETGKSLEYAKTLQDIFNHAFAAKVVSMDEYDLGNLEHEALLLVITSTFGNGDPPGNGESLAQALMEMSHNSDETKAKEETKRFNCVNSVSELLRRGSSSSLLKDSVSEMQEVSGLLPNLRFSVFGLGSRAYPHFCAFAHAVDSLLGEMQGERLLEIGEGDELCGQEESFRSWAKEVFKIACETFCVGEDVSSEAASASLTGQDRSWSPKKFRISLDVETEDDEADLLQDMNTFYKKNLSTCTVSQRKNLQSGDTDRSTILVELDANEPQMSYNPGDHIGIYPCNQPELVDQILSRLTENIDDQTPIQLQMFQQRSTPVGMISNWVPERLPVCTLRAAFERYLDITTCPSPLMLKIFADCASNEEEKARLMKLSEGKREYEEWKFHHLPNLPEVLAEFPSVRVEASLLLSQLQPLQCRYYSISSSPDLHPGQVHCTVAVVNYRTEGGKGPIHHGVCSSYLNRLPLGSEIHCFIRPAASFHLPEDASVPCLLIGPGTGIAPFRSFWQQRVHDISQGKQVGEMALLFGCRHPDRDHLYKDEIAEAQKCGAITHYTTAFSRLEGKPKQYVQDVLKEEWAHIAHEWIVNKKGHLYVCGDVTMADCVKNAFVEILQEKCDITRKKAKDQVTSMKTRQIFHEDIFGVTLRTYEVNKSVRQRHISKA